MVSTGARTIGRKTMHKIAYAGVVGVALCVVAAVSYVTTHYYADGRVPGGAYTISIMGDGNQPLPGARITTAAEGGWRGALVNLHGSESILTDANGSATIFVRDRGLPCGKEGWVLFWGIRITSNSSLERIRFLIMAEGYRPTELTGTQVFLQSRRARVRLGR